MIKQLFFSGKLKNMDERFKKIRLKHWGVNNSEKMPGPRRARRRVSDVWTQRVGAVTRGVGWRRGGAAPLTFLCWVELRAHWSLKGNEVKQPCHIQAQWCLGGLGSTWFFEGPIIDNSWWGHSRKGVEGDRNIYRLNRHQKDNNRILRTTLYQ